ncbi:MAG: GEVED domain-containing protein, partial [Bacteroidales bacterium]
YTSFPGDTGYENDTTCVTYYGRPVIDAALTRITSPQNGCGIAQDSVRVMVRNKGIVPVNTPFDISYQVEGDTTVITQQVSTVVIPVNDSSEVVFATPVNLSTLKDSIFRFTAWVSLAGDLNHLNDTTRSEAQITPKAQVPAISDTTIFFGTQMTFNLQTNDSVYWYDSDTATAWFLKGKTFTTPILFDTTTYWAEAIPGPSFAASQFIFTEVCQFRSTTGQPANGWPTWLIADDYIEISGVPGSDLGGLTLEQWTTSMLSSYTFPPGTLISPWGTAVIAVGQLTTSTPSPANYYYHGTGSFTGGFSSTQATGRLLKDTNGVIIDAVGYAGYTFLPASGVTSANWSGTIAGANAGIRLTGNYSKSATGWIQSNGTSRQDPNGFNIGIALPGDQICPSGRVPATVNIAGIPPYDIVAESVTAPSGCALQMEPVKITVFNRGDDTLKGGMLTTYRINNDPWQPYETIPDTLAPGDTITYTFSNLANLAAPITKDTVYRIKAFIKAPLDVYPVNDTIISDSIVSFRTSPMPAVSPQTTTIPYGTSTVLLASSNYPIEWFADDTASIPLGIGKTFSTPPLTDTTVYWAGTVASLIPPTILNLGTQSSVYTAIHTRGFYFQAPVNMIITELRAPATLPVGPQFIQVVKFPSIPLTYPSAGPHTTLAYFPNIPFGAVQPTEIHVQAGEYIGIMGGTAQLSTNGTTTGQMHNSYNNSETVWLSIAGYNNIAVTRIGYQNAILNGPAPSGTIHRGGGSSLGRIEMQYIVPGPGCASVRVPVHVNVLGQSGCDISAAGVTGPISAVLLGASEQVKVRLVNLGSSPQSNFQVGYQVDNRTPVQEIFTGTLPPNDTVEYTFQMPADLGVPGSIYTLASWTHTTCDQNSLNDTAYSIVEHIHGYCISTANDTAYQDITSINLHTLNNQSPPAGNTYTNYVSVIPPTVLSPGQTYPMTISSSFVAPSTTQNSCHVKAWIDFNRDGVFDPVTELVLSQPIQSSQTITSGITVPWTAKTGNALMRVVLNQTTVPANVEPCGTYAYGETEDYLVMIAPAVPKDIAIIAVNEPADYVISGAPLPVRITVMNTGSSIINPGELLASYTLNGGNAKYAYYQHSLAPDSTDTILLPDWIPAPGENTLHFSLDMSSDSLVFNNQMVKYVFGELHATIPYYDDFETVNSWYKPKNVINWQLGQPSGTTINSAYSGTKAWHTILDGQAPATTTDYLYSPVFDFSLLGVSDAVRLSFYHYLHTNSCDNYGQVHFSLDSGQTWSNLGNNISSSWYNLCSNGNCVFCSNGFWQLRYITLPPAVFNGNPSVRFRFYAKTTGSIYFKGWAIDDFRLSLLSPVAIDVGVAEVTLPATDTVPGSSLYPTVKIVNYGTGMYQSIPVTYAVDGITVASETWTGMITGFDTTHFTFSTPFTVPSNPYQLCASTALTTDTVLFNDTKCNYFNVSQVVNDLSVTQILYPLADPSNQICYYNPQTQPWYTYDAIIRIENHGMLPQSSFPIRYSFDGGNTTYTDQWTGTLASGTHTDIQLATKFQPVFGPQQFCAETDLPGDNIPGNNISCKTYIGTECIGIDDPDQEGLFLGQNVPNPAIDLTSIMFSVPSEGEIRIKLINISGLVMYAETNWVEPGSHHIPLDISALPSGVYVYSLEFKGQRLWRKMIITH